MEEVILRFPHLANRIFENLSYNTLQNCLRVSKPFNGFINFEKKIWINLLEKILNKYDKLSDTSRNWKIILKNIKREEIINFAKLILAKNRYWVCDTPFKILVKYKKNHENHVNAFLIHFSWTIIHFRKTHKNSKTNPTINKSLKNALEISKLIRDTIKQQ